MQVNHGPLHICLPTTCYSQDNVHNVGVEVHVDFADAPVSGSTVPQVQEVCGRDLRTFDHVRPCWWYTAQLNVCNFADALLSCQNCLVNCILACTA
jgi:hypothetical protein